MLSLIGYVSAMVEDGGGFFDYCHNKVVAMRISHGSP